MTMTTKVGTQIQDSIGKNQKDNPIDEPTLWEARFTLGQALNGLTPTGAQRRAFGQPFLLDLISALAKTAGDPDWHYPLTLHDGVPLGVDEPIDPTPGIWNPKPNGDTPYRKSER